MPEDPREAVRRFLDTCPPALPPALPLIPEDRRAGLLEDAGRALAFMGGEGAQVSPLQTPAQDAAAHVFAFAGQVWAAFLEDPAAPPALTASRLRVWAYGQAQEAAAPLPPPVFQALEGSFPQVGEWYRLATVTGSLTPQEAGACAAWYAVGTVAAWGAWQGFEDGQPEDLCQTVLEGLEVPAPRTIN